MKRATVRRAEQEVYTFLKGMDRLRRYVDKLAPEDIPADLATFGASAQAFLTRLEPFVERRRLVAKLRSGLGGFTTVKNALRAMEAVDPKHLEAGEVDRLRAQIAKYEPLVPEIKAVLASLSAAKPVDTADLERMLQSGRWPRKGRKGRS
jgi:hypothetical protein